MEFLNYAYPYFCELAICPMGPMQSSIWAVGSEKIEMPSS
uniref:Uncharacterized protein n=1 Tax=Arundo donax TaxID=35708 RepID=A0A0A9CPK7_ARUDO